MLSSRGRQSTAGAIPTTSAVLARTLGAAIKMSLLQLVGRGGLEPRWLAEGSHLGILNRSASQSCALRRAWEPTDCC
jgi:hypothetical protein